MKYQIVSLSKFLSRYGLLNGYGLTKLTHEDALRLFPKLKTVKEEDFEKDPDLIDSGKIIYVQDRKDTIAYYIPSTLEETDIMDFNSEIVKEKEQDDTVYDYANMSIYNLRCLLKRTLNSYRNQCCARKELKRRGIVLRKKYNRNDFKKMEE